jgi:large subunit ribosomal protein L18
MKIDSYSRRKLRVRNKIKSNNKSGYPRLCVFRSNKNFYAQLVDDGNCGNIIASYSSLKLDDKSKSGVEIASIVGKEISKICLDKNVTSVVFDKGPYLYNGRVESFAQSCRSNGLKF